MPLDASNTDQSVSAKDEFNAKIVKRAEFKQQYKKLVKTDFTFTEKVRLIVSKPLKIARGIKMALKVMTDPSVKQQLSAQSPDGSQGMYLDDQKKIYMNGAYLNVCLKSLYNTESADNYTKKSLAIANQAFENCQDYKNKPSLRPM
ncbi:MAG: hypothetical protein ACQEQL_05160 [Pseudomonadota bacterium]